MTDRYQSFTASPLGKLFVKNLGIPNPTPLERWSEGAPIVFRNIEIQPLK